MKRLRRTLAVPALLFMMWLTCAGQALANETVNADDWTRLRTQSVEVLDEALHENGVFWVNVHAAEALIANLYTDGIEERFLTLEKSPESHPIGIARVLARLNRNDELRHRKYVNRIVDIFLDESSQMRLHALESLGKLGYGEHLPEIVAAAQSDSVGYRAFARWVLANSGSPEDEAYLAELLKSPEPRDYFYTAYALRFMDTVEPETGLLLKATLNRLPHDAPYRVYVASSWYVHAPEDQRSSARDELLSYLDGENVWRYEIGNALAIRGDSGDVPVLERLLNDTDVDVRIGAAQALLRIERRQFRGLSLPDWMIIGLYAAAMIGIGLYFARRQKSTEEYLLGGRRVNPLVAGISTFASYLSTISYLAISGEVIKHGPVIIIIQILTLPVVYWISAYFLIPYFMKLPITSAYEIIDRPLGKGTRLAGSVIFIMTRFVWMALLIYLTSKALAVMMNWDESYIPLISVAGGIITVIYSTMGGLNAVLTTDVTQFTILLLGAILTVVLTSMRMGGVGVWIPTEWSPQWDDIVFFSTDPHIRTTIVFAFIHLVSWWVCTAGSDQMAIQRFASTRDVKAARRSFLVTQISEKTVFVVLMTVGFALFRFYNVFPQYVPDGRDLVSDADFLFPNFIANHLPAGISGLVVAAIFSAAMSSLSSGINSTAAVITTDIIPFFRKSFDAERSSLRLARWSSLAIGVLVVAISTTMAHVPGNIFEVTSKTNGLFVAPLFNLFFMALFVRYATPFGTVMGSIWGLAFAVIIAFWDVLTGGPGITFLWILPGALVVSITTSMLLSLIPTRRMSVTVRTVLATVFLVPPLAIFFFIWSI